MTFTPALTSSLSAPSIGFVVYHQGVAVNDFRYLSQPEKLRLDWRDPWYSRFENRNLLRRYRAPAAVFLYVEPWEVRKKIIFRTRSLQDWGDPGIDGATANPASERAEGCRRAVEGLDQHSRLEIDGQPVPGTLLRVDFIRRTLRTSGVVPAVDAIDLDTGLLGVIYVYPLVSLPD